MIKNLLFVGKVIYFISPESNINSLEEVKDEEIRETENGEDADGDESDHEEEKEIEGEEEDEEENDDEKDHRPPSLLWLMKKLSLMAKREAAYAPKVPLKVSRYLVVKTNIHTQGSA